MEMMTNAQFYMSTKLELNDPLDSTFTIELEDYLNLYYAKYPSSKNEKDMEFSKLIFQNKLERFTNDWMNDIDETQSKMRVTCFTEDGNNPLMWSHYAENHTGVCLKFDLEMDENLKNSILPVVYTDELINAKTTEDFKKCLLTKLRAWEVEKEWRIISEKEYFDFKQEALVEILFGLKVPEKTIKWFKYFSENGYFKTPINRLKLMGNKLIKIDQYDDIVIE